MAKKTFILLTKDYCYAVLTIGVTSSEDVFYFHLLYLLVISIQGLFDYGCIGSFLSYY
jgi:hypothetical protein